MRYLDMEIVLRYPNISCWLSASELQLASCRPAINNSSYLLLIRVAEAASSSEDPKVDSDWLKEEIRVDSDWFKEELE